MQHPSVPNVPSAPGSFMQSTYGSAAGGPNLLLAGSSPAIRSNLLVPAMPTMNKVNSVPAFPRPATPLSNSMPASASSTPPPFAPYQQSLTPVRPYMPSAPNPTPAVNVGPGANLSAVPISQPAPQSRLLRPYLPSNMPMGVGNSLAQSTMPTATPLGQFSDPNRFTSPLTRPTIAPYMPASTAPVLQPPPSSYNQPAHPQFMPPAQYQPPFGVQSLNGTSSVRPPVSIDAIASRDSNSGFSQPQYDGSVNSSRSVSPKTNSAHNFDNLESQSMKSDQMDRGQEQYNPYTGQPGLIGRRPVALPPPAMAPMPNLNQQMAAATLKDYQTPMSAKPPGISVAPVARGTFMPTNVNLLQAQNILPEDGFPLPQSNMFNESSRVNCSKDIFRCTLNAIPETQQVLNKSRLPFGILLHPFKDLQQLPVVSGGAIVRCRSCRTYINPFVYFVDSKRWKCNVCFRLNDVPEEFTFDPVSKTYGDPQRRPEIRSATIEFVAPAEYMLRPPQPAVYLFLLDTSLNALQTGYLSEACRVLADELDRMPGDSRTQIGFVTFAETMHFFNLAEGRSKPQVLVMSDIDDPYLPLPDGLLVNLRDCRELVGELLEELPAVEEEQLHAKAPTESGNCLGSCLQAAFKLLAPTGGRVTVFLSELPSVGLGALQPREDPNDRSGKYVQHLQPATDFYKKLALECSAAQIGVDLFFINSRYADIATISCISRFSSGQIFYYPSLHCQQNVGQLERLREDFRRYLTRKIGFEAVMRVRCTHGINLHSFHGNFFVRSVDLLSLPNVNPDAGYAIQLSLDESLTDCSVVSFQAALLYTSSKGERRIRVHTMCLPVTNNVGEVIDNADQVAIVGLLSKLAVDRAVQASTLDAREAMVNACIDSLSAYLRTLPKQSLPAQTLLAPNSLRLMPLLVCALLKLSAFVVGTSVKTDERVYSMELCKSWPLKYLLTKIYPRLYALHQLETQLSESMNGGAEGDGSALLQEDESGDSSQSGANSSARSADSDGARSHARMALPQLQLSSRNIDRTGLYLVDAADELYLYVGSCASPKLVGDVFGCMSVTQINEGWTHLPELDNTLSRKMHKFIDQLRQERPFHSPLFVVRDDGRYRLDFYKLMVDDKSDSCTSYFDFLQHLAKEVK